MNLYTKNDFLSAVRNLRKPVAFLLGSPLSLDQGGGVPGITDFVNIIREEIRELDEVQLERFESALNGLGGVKAYQAAIRWLHGNFLQDAVNRVVEKAVLRARKPGAPEQFDENGIASDWYLPKGTKSVAELATRHFKEFPGPILTTNFDPLFAVGVESAGGVPNLHVIDSDGNFGRTASLRTGVAQIVHLHGYWRGADTLHTFDQLTAPRPKLKASLQFLLRSRTLIVVAYGGWDDAFADALSSLLADGHPDDVRDVNVMWCFLEDSPEAVAVRYGPLLDRMKTSRFVAYGGIDCHTIFSEIAQSMKAVSAGQPRTVPGSDSILAGWQRIEGKDLSGLTELSIDELLGFFDGAVPSWRHSISRAIPRRQAVFQITKRITTFNKGNFGCSLQLIRAAGGEGKTTVLLQAAADLAREGHWTVLWRTNPSLPLSADCVLDLDVNRLWLVVADDAENLIEDLCVAAQKLHAAGRSNVHFLIAARDADWWSKFGDKPPWESWLTAWVRRNDAVTLRGITHDDAEAVVKAWAECGDNGLRDLRNLVEYKEQVNTFIQAVRSGDNCEHPEGGRNTTLDGSFFGGLLAVRFGQNGLQKHVSDFLERLSKIEINGSSINLATALVYVAACHAVGIPGLEETVLADLLGIPHEWVHEDVVTPLGEEAAAVRSAGHIFTRHRHVAIAIVVEVSRHSDLSQVWSAIVRHMIRRGKETKVGLTFPLIVHAGPSLAQRLPTELPKEQRTDIAIAAAQAAMAEDPDRLDYIVDIGKTFRVGDRSNEAVRMFRENLSKAQMKVDAKHIIRGFWNEWGLAEATAAVSRQGSIICLWLQGVALSDYLDPAPITEENIKHICAGIASSCGRLVSEGQCAYTYGRRAAVYLGKLAFDDLKAHLFEYHEREADKHGTPYPRTIDEAFLWLIQAIEHAALELDCEFHKALRTPLQTKFSRFQEHFPKSDEPKVRSGRQQNVSSFGGSNMQANHTEKSAFEYSNLPSHGDPDDQNDKLRADVLKVTMELIEKSMVRGKLLSLPLLGKVLGYEFKEYRPIYMNLGFRDLSSLIVSYSELSVTGGHPARFVKFREEWEQSSQRDLRIEVWKATKELLDKCLFERRDLLLPTLGCRLSERFPESRPIHANLGFDSLTSLVRSYEDFEISGEKSAPVVRYKAERIEFSSGDLRSDVFAVISGLIEDHKRNGRPLLLPFVGLQLAKHFPDATPIHKSLGFHTLTDLVASYEDFSFEGDHSRLAVVASETVDDVDPSNLRFLVWSAIDDLLNRYESNQRPLFVAAVGIELAERRLSSRPIQYSLGFSSLSELIESFEDFIVSGTPKQRVVLRRCERAL